PLPTVNTTGYIDHAAFLGTINPDTNKIPKHLFQGYLNIYNPKKLFRIRMSRNFGMKMLTMTNLSTECLIQLTKLGYDATPFNQILKQNAKREMRLRLGKVTVADVLAAQPVTTNLLKFMRASIKMIGVSNLQSFIASMT